MISTLVAGLGILAGLVGAVGAGVWQLHVGGDFWSASDADNTRLLQLSELWLWSTLGTDVLISTMLVWRILHLRRNAIAACVEPHRAAVARQRMRWIQRVSVVTLGTAGATTLCALLTVVL